MDNNELRNLVETFKEYRDLLTPIQAGLSDFAESFELLKNDVKRLDASFGAEAKDNMRKIYNTLSAQASRASELGEQINAFSKLSAKYTSEVTKLLSSVESIADKMKAVNELEQRAAEQIERLDAMLEDKRKNYNVKELQKSLDSYNSNIQKVADFINKDIAKTLSENKSVIDDIKEGNDDLKKKLEQEKLDVGKLVETYSETNALLKKFAEKQDVNEAYLFEILDKWADDRKIKRK